MIVTMKWLTGAPLALALMGLVLSVGGCTDDGSGNAGGPPVAPSAAGGPPPSAEVAPSDPSGSAPAAPLGESPTTKQIMTALTKGRGSLTPTIGRELETEPPPWIELEPQAAEFARLASALGRNEPPKGSPESWAQLTTRYATSAAALEQAVREKDRDAALAAHRELAQSCMDCHRQHRVMGRGAGMGPGGGGPPDGRGPGGGPPR